MNRIAGLFLLFLAGSLAFAAGNPAALTQQGFSGQGRYRIEIVATGKFLDLKLEDKKSVQQWAGGGAQNQQWDFVDAGEGYYFITSVETGSVLDVDGRNRDGATVIAAARGNSDNQKWKIADNGRGEFTIISKAGKSLESPAGKREDGVKLQVWGPHGLENQRFRLTRVGDLETKVRPREGTPNPPASTVPAVNAFAGKGRYQIRIVASGHYLDLRRENSSTLQQWSGSGALNQQWDVEDAGNGYFYFRSVETGRVLEVTGSRDGSAIVAKGQQTGSDNQKWRVVDTGNGQCAIVSKNGKALDLPNSARNEGQSLQLWSEQRRDNQRFLFTRIETTERLTGGRTREPRPRDQMQQQAPYTPGRLNWRGRVDTEILLEVRGNTVTEKSSAGRSFNNGRFNFSAPLPARELEVRVENKKVRGSIEVVERPTAANGYAVVLRIRDPQRDAADYEFDLIW